MKILITGGNGYIGSSLYEKLSLFYEVYRITRVDLDLSNLQAVDSYFFTHKFDVVIHSASSGGSRLSKDSSDVLDNNILMYYNLLRNKNSFKKLINLGSGADINAFDSPYGLSKYVIKKSVEGVENFYNLRIFGIFDENELNTRFIKSSIINYILGKDIVVLDDKAMDFIYMEDFISIVRKYIELDKLPKNHDCIYSISHRLSDIADKINHLGDNRVAVKIIENKGKEYRGEYSELKIKYMGFDNGLQIVFNRLKDKYLTRKN